MHWRVLGGSVAALLLAACQHSATGNAATAHSRTIEDIAFAQASCGGCHAVEYPGISPDPASPTFAEIAQRHGTTQRTLAVFLRDAHNYPEAMDFELTPQQADALATYMISLRGAGQ